MTRTASLLACLAILACAFAALGGSLHGGFVWDDRPLILDNPGVKDPAMLPSIFTSGFWQTGDRHDRFRAFYRPAVLLSYALDHAIWGRRAFGFHLANLVLHALCSLLVFHLARSEGLGRLAATAGACLFAVHPVHVESVAWISGRTDLLCTLFMLLAFAAHRLAARDRGRRALRIGLRAASLGFFALALSCKEMAATLPLLIFADRWLEAAPAPHGAGGPANAGRRARAWSAVRSSWPYLAVFALYLVARYVVLGGSGERLYVLGPLAWAATAIFVLARDATLLLLPVGLDAHYPYPPRTTLADLAVAVSFLILALVVVSGWRVGRRSPRAAFWLVWIPISLLPTLVFGGFGDVLLADRFLYAPSVGLAVLLAAGLHTVLAMSRSSESGRPGPLFARVAPRVVLAASGAVIGLFLMASAKRARVWTDDLTLFRNMAETSPGSAMVHANLGIALYDRGEDPAAKAEFFEAVRLIPGYSMAHNNLAAAFEREGLLSQALAQYREALRLAPNQLESRINAAGLLVRLGHEAEGLSVLRIIVREHPRYPQALYALADALERVGRWEESLEYLRTARLIDPDLASPHYLIGKILYSQGRYAEAADSMKSFLALWPNEGVHRQAAMRVIAKAESARIPDSPPPPVL